MTGGQAVRHWSTSSLPEATRFDYWQSTLNEALWPVSEWSDISGDFHVELREASLGCLSSLFEVITPHRSRRTARDVRRSADECYHLFLTGGPSWGLSHRGRSECLAEGSLVVVGGEEHETSVPHGFSGLVIKCPATWLRSWVPNPDLIVGRAIAQESRWGRVLAPMLSQLTPELAVAPPLPAGVLVDQVGVVLAMMVGSAESRAMPDLVKKIRSYLRERRSEPQLTADDIASLLNIPPRLLHRTLAKANTTFAKELLEARVAGAMEMLRSRAAANLTLAEIARQSGFTSPTHFSRIVKRRTGRSPQNWRREPR
jgi:AraC family transcriptional activator of tynA and feaB